MQNGMRSYLYHDNRSKLTKFDLVMNDGAAVEGVRVKTVSTERARRRRHDARTRT